MRHRNQQSGLTGNDGVEAITIAPAWVPKNWTGDTKRTVKIAEIRRFLRAVGGFRETQAEITHIRMAEGETKIISVYAGSIHLAQIAWYPPGTHNKRSCRGLCICG